MQSTTTPSQHQVLSIFKSFATRTGDVIDHSLYYRLVKKCVSSSHGYFGPLGVVKMSVLSKCLSVTDAKNTQAEAEGVFLPELIK